MQNSFLTGQFRTRWGPEHSWQRGGPGGVLLAGPWVGPPWEPLGDRWALAPDPPGAL